MVHDEWGVLLYVLGGRLPESVIKGAVYHNSLILQILLGYRLRRENLRINLPLVLYSCIIPKDFLVLIFYFWKYPGLKVLFPSSLKVLSWSKARCQKFSSNIWFFFLPLRTHFCHLLIDKITSIYKLKKIKK